MIDINQHGRYHDQKSNPPTITEENTGYESGNQEMKNEMKID